MNSPGFLLVVRRKLYEMSYRFAGQDEVMVEENFTANGGKFVPAGQVQGAGRLRLSA
jgi:hypothetical protein